MKKITIEFSCDACGRPTPQKEARFVGLSYGDLCACAECLKDERVAKLFRRAYEQIPPAQAQMNAGNSHGFYNGQAGQ